MYLSMCHAQWVLQPHWQGNSHWEVNANGTAPEEYESNLGSFKGQIPSMVQPSHCFAKHINCMHTSR
jgi:hypothetical protein